MAFGTINVPGVTMADLNKVKETAERALKAVQRVAYVIDTRPYQTETLTFTGEEQSPTWGAFDPEKLEISGDTAAVNAGEYEAVFTPKGDYVWADESQNPVVVKWTIQRVAISSVPSQSGALIYNGAAQTPEWLNFDNTMLTIGGTTSGTDAGSYTATFTPKANYQWPDGSTVAKSITWSIGRASISIVPSQSGSLAYTRSALSPSWSGYDSAKMILGGTTSGTNAGTYTATFTPNANYQWADGDTAEKSVNWSIGKAAGSMSLNKTSMTLNKSAQSGSITVTRAGNGAITATSSNTSVATVSVSGTTVTVTGKGYGSVTITIKVAAGTNHNAPGNKTCSVTANLFNATLNSNTWAAIRAASDAGEAANWWSVGATKSITINGKIGNTTFSNLTVDAFIIGFNHNSNREGTKRIHFQIGKIGGKLVGLVGSNYDNYSSDAKNFQMNASKTNSGGWSGSYMRKTLLGNSSTPTNPLANSFMAALPSDLRAVMKSVTKYSDNTGGGSDFASYVTATTDYLFLLAEFECFGASAWAANNAEKNFQAQYDYYKAGNGKVHYKHNATSAIVNVWGRSVDINDSENFVGIGEDNDFSASFTAIFSLALAPGFCV